MQDWVKEEYIVDVNSTKPEGWNDEIDGEYTPNKIKNPAFKGEWTPKEIDNPAYKGKWTPKTIPNPNFKEIKNPAQYESITGIGLDVWQVLVCK